MEVINGGEVVEFNPDKIYQAIFEKAAQVVYVSTDAFATNLACDQESCYGFG